MTCYLRALTFAASDPAGLARFWADVLDREIGDDGAGGVVLPPDGASGFRIRFVPSPMRKIGQNPMHFDLTSTSLDDQRQTVARSLNGGAKHIDVGQRPEEGHVVLADPEGNEFCVIEPGNTFLEGCGFLGAVACDGSQAVGYFWSTVLGWPLVWDQHQETAIRSPLGGPKITWGGTPTKPGTGNRLHFDIAPDADGNQQGEAKRLLAIGATRIEPGHGADGPGALDPGAVGRVVLADPDGNEFCLLNRQ